MKVILYIGHHKVGSTALQVYLAQNWLRLAQAGILYPSVESRGFSHNLGKAVGAETPHLPHDVNIREPHSALAYQMIRDVSRRPVPPQFKALPAVPQMIHALRNQVAMLRPKALILCSEAFANFGAVDPALITRLADLFPKAEFEIYCALRRPDDYLVSWHGQRLKVGEKVAGLAGGGVTEYFGTIHFDYRLVANEWAARIPEARLILRNYSDILAAGGSTEDFAARIGIDLPAGMAPAGRPNKSLPRAAFAIMQRANRDLAPEMAHRLARHLIEDGNGLTPTPCKEVEMLGTHRRRDIARRFAPIHDSLNKLSGQKQFFPDIEDIRLPRAIPEADAAAALLAQIDPARLPTAELGHYVERLQANFRP